MGDNTEILKAIRLMQDNPKYWILSSQTIMVGSDKDGTPIFSPEENCFKNKIVITIPEKYPNSIYEWVAMRCYDGYHRWEHTATYDNKLDLSDLAREYDEWKSTSISHEQLHQQEGTQIVSNSSKYTQCAQQSSLNKSITDFLKDQHIYYSNANQFATMFGKAGCPSKTPGKDCMNRIYITCPMSDDDYELKYRKSSPYEVKGKSKFWTVMKTSDGRYYWEELGDINFQEEVKKALENGNPVLEFKNHVKHDPMVKSDIVRLFIKMRPQLEKYICHIETGNKDPWTIIQHFPKLDNYDKFLYQDEFGNISMVDYDEQLGYFRFNLFNLKECDTLIEEERKKIFEFQKENAWEWAANANGRNNASASIGGYWNEGSDAGQFKLNSNDQAPIFRTTFTANIGHDKKDIDNILKESTTSAVEPNSISQRLKYMKMKEKKYGNSVTQNITVNGDNNTVIGISMTQTSKDDCEQTQTVVIKNSKSEKKKEKRETVLGTLHQALINLAKIIETYTKYLLDHCFDFFD